ncbi:transglutaminase family protein [Echinicola vietnamensis]|uniref:Transglutaminase-like enzyme, predicted cysteine protease n=1 Tax=Echinicola vietnamensis (strain DSM 17526 / LMG 23754 / KMM 6221) TaxID=926556 RepID=L0G5B2_ECHVK|nr:transglutaminase family protein [Echinicola vietnamensis]AGA80201.1 transglutaminase-like enzyme, predicted cysteine protease [Echinicola vietnamensis DSM 17526]
MNSEKRLQIIHNTCYRYAGKVKLSPQKILLSPSNRRYFQVHSVHTSFSPAPKGINQRLDMEGNLFQQVWFDQEVEKFEINTQMELTVFPVNPFEFIIEKSFEKRNEAGELSFRYDEEKQAYLRPFLTHDSSGNICDLARQFMGESTNAVDFLVKITAHIHHLCTHIIREDPGIWSPQKTLSEKKGSCRDLAWLLITILRGVGIASRFVSGYAYNPDLEENHELHAWVEAYCPGAGWIGLDPSLGLLTDAGYIPLAASFLPHLTLPVDGTYTGNYSSHLESSVEIKEL